jgi:hypothetical protein
LIPFQGFAPDLDPATPGIFVDCSQWIPYEAGFEAAPSATTPPSTPALAAACRGAAVLTNLSGTNRTFAGTATKIYELSAGSWSDVAAAGDYNLGTENRWTFCQFGNASIAASKTEDLQFTTSGDFADVAGAPKAAIVLSVAGFVMLLNYNNGTDTPHGWYCSALRDYTDWTPDVDTQCAFGLLLQTPGAITSGARLGEGVVVGKARSLIRMDYQGGDIIWQTTVVSDEIGCVGPHAMIPIANMVAFASPNGIWIYDGSYPMDISGPIKQWWTDNLSASLAYRTELAYEETSQRLWVYFANTQATTNPNDCLVYHMGTKRWGRAARTIETTVREYAQPSITWDGLGSLYSTWNDLPTDISYDSSFWTSGSRNLAVVDTAHQIKTLTGSAEASSFTSNDFGDDIGVTMATEVVARYLSAPTTATCRPYSKFSMDANFSVLNPSSISRSDSKYHLRSTGRFHRFLVSHTGPAKADGIQVQFVPAGKR